MNILNFVNVICIVVGFVSLCVATDTTGDEVIMALGQVLQIMPLVLLYYNSYKVFPDIKRFEYINNVTMALLLLVILYDLVACSQLGYIVVDRRSVYSGWLKTYIVMGVVVYPLFCLLNLFYTCYFKTIVRMIVDTDERNKNINNINFNTNQLDKKPFIPIIVSEGDVDSFTNGNYLNFLLHLYTKVLLNSGYYSGSKFQNDILLPESEYIDAYVYFSCWTLGHLILKNIVLKVAYLTKDISNPRQLVKLDRLYDLANQVQDLDVSRSECKLNEEVVDLLLDGEVRTFVGTLLMMITSKKFVDFLNTTYNSIHLIEFEISDYNSIYQQYNKINNTQLQKQLKKYVLLNSKHKREKRERLYKKKLLYLASEYLVDLVKIDCIEESYIMFFEDYISRKEPSAELMEKWNKIRNNRYNTNTSYKTNDSLLRNNSVLNESRADDLYISKEYKM